MITNKGVYFMGSAKDVDITYKPRYNRLGKATFTFKDTYSVDDLVAAYDIQMANEIPKKGEALWRMTNYNFQVLVPDVVTHYRKGYSKASDKPGALPKFIIEVLAAMVYKDHIRLGGEPIPGPKMNVDFVYDIPSKATNLVIPLEVITRNELGPDSSIMKMYKKGEITPQDIGLKSIPEDGKLEQPVITYTTKHEQGDKFLTRKQAMVLSGLKPEQFKQMEALEMVVHNAIDAHTAKVAQHYEIDLVHPDGKREWIWNKNYPRLSDCFGTFDEDRFEIILDDNAVLKLSKQVLRDWMRSTPWYQEKFLPWKQIVDKLGKEKKSEWPAIEPAPQIPENLMQYVSNMYDIGSKMWTLEASEEEAHGLIEQFHELRRMSIIR
jgi:phosphoribosylaminoimidazole-succinocarboxamide synthase